MKNALQKVTKFFCFTLLLFAQNGILSAQDFMMQGWYWDYPKTCNGYNWAGTLNGQAADLGAAGFTYVWLPPMSRASFGSCSNGYDPQDLYDLGEYGGGATGFGSRSDVDALIAALGANGVNAVADVVYNHRDGGAPELNQAVEDYITIHYDATKGPFPSDRYRCVLPLGGSSGNGAGDYYFKISSKSQSNRFYNKAYTVRMETSLVGNQGPPFDTEAEPNGGGDCGEGFNTLGLGVQLNANVDALGCTVDEFKLTLNTGDFNAAGDQLIIYLTNPNGDYSDHRIYGIWNAAAAQDVVGQLDYQTYTDFTSLPSGQGQMNFENFKPNTSNTSTTTLNGDWDWLWFFYDYDQNSTDTQDKLYDWTQWLWDDVNIRGFRMDAVKHFDPAFVGNLLDFLHGNGADPGLVVGEVFDSNPYNLKNWVSNVQASMDGSTLNSIDVRVFDFALRSALKNASDNFGYDVRNVFQSGIVDAIPGSNGFNVVTFLNNHDFRGPGEPVQNDPMLGYAYLLTNNQVGLPTVFYPDYYGVTLPNAPTVNLKAQIDQLMGIHQQYIFNSGSVDYLSRFSTPYSSSYTSGFDHTTLLYQLSGGIGGVEVLVAINYAGEALVVDHQINMTNVNATDVFEDLTGNALTTTATFNGSNQLHLEIPARSYAVFIQNNSPAPVTLLDFSARPQPKSVLLEWQVAEEIDLAGYSVERSLDGRQFSKIGWQAARNASQNSSAYLFMDESVIPGRKYYYRLQMEEQSGDKKYSAVREVQLTGISAGHMHLSPNPVGDSALLEWEADQPQEMLLQLLQSSGQLVWEQNITTGRGLQTKLLDTGSLTPGVYYLRMYSRDQQWVEKMVKL